MIRPRIKKFACAVALLGIFLRVLLPALHTHGHDHGSSARSDAVPTACSCGVVHQPATTDPDRDPDGESVDAAPEAHVCLACALEEGTPANCPPAPDAHIARSHPDGSRARSTDEVFAGNQVRLPAPRAPPGNES